MFQVRLVSFSGVADSAKKRTEKLKDVRKNTIIVIDLTGRYDQNGLAWWLYFLFKTQSRSDSFIST